MRKHLIKECILMFLAVFTLYNLNTYIDYRTDYENKTYRNLLTSSDAVPNTFLPFAIINHQTLRFDKIKNNLKEFQSIKNQLPYFLIKTNDHYYSVYPPLTGIMAVPVYFIPLIFKWVPALNLWDYMLKILVLGRITASLYTAISVVFVYLSLKKLSENNKLITLFTLFYALGTCTWSISSRSLWQHTTSEFFISIIVYLLLCTKEKPKLIPLIGFLTSLAVLARPTDVFITAFVALYVFINYKKYFIPFILTTIPSVIFMLSYNHAAYGSAFSSGYSARSDVKWSTPILEGIIGFLISPSRSFLFVSPPLLLSYYGVFKIFKDKNFGGIYRNLYAFLSIGFVISILVFSKWYDWSGANGFGYRMLVDFLPILIVFSFEIAKNFSKAKIFLLFLLMVYSSYIQYNAVFNLMSRCSEKNNWDIKCLKLK